jgi:hypothetical protein
VEKEGKENFAVSLRLRKRTAIFTKNCRATNVCRFWWIAQVFSPCPDFHFILGPLQRLAAASPFQWRTKIEAEPSALSGFASWKAVIRLFICFALHAIVGLF